MKFIRHPVPEATQKAHEEDPPPAPPFCPWPEGPDKEEAKDRIKAQMKKLVGKTEVRGGRMGKRGEGKKKAGPEKNRHPARQKKFTSCICQNLRG